MKKFLFLIISICLVISSIPVYAQDIITYERNEANRYGIDESIDLNSNTINHALRVPYVDNSIYIYDFAGLLQDYQVEVLHNKLKELNDEYGVIIVTTDNVNNLSTRDYADDFYDYNNFKKDGILLLIDMENREVYISTTYYGQILVDNSRVDDILDEITPKLSSSNYYDACSSFIEMVEEYIKDGPSYAMKNCEIINSYGDYSCPKMLPVFGIILGCLIFSIIITFIITRKYKKIVLAKNANYYLKNGEIVLGNKMDNFINTHTSRVYINRSSSSSGGGSSHRSSSGRSHGGGGRRF